jgi:TetR/AcrR family transcriptional regulator, transcriptional repressor for nem operon
MKMRYTPDHKQKTRARILESAATAFRRQGYHATGVDTVMEEAGLTAGGFYAHFPSKDALLAEALEHYAAKASGKSAARLEEGSDLEWVKGMVDHYLGASHRGHPERGCPIPTLASEVSRAGKAPRQAFERLVGDLIASIAAHLPPDQAEDRAIAIVALCVGGMTLARAVHDPGLSDRILGACREFAHESLESRAHPRARESRRRPEQEKK